MDPSLGIGVALPRTRGKGRRATAPAAPPTPPPARRPPVCRLEHERCSRPSPRERPPPPGGGRPRPPAPAGPAPSRRRPAAPDRPPAAGPARSPGPAPAPPSPARWPRARRLGRPPSADLVGAGGEVEPVRHHDGAALQRRPDHPAHQVRPRHQIQEQLRRGSRPERGSRTSRRASSASGVPPGSRTTRTSRPAARSRSASRAIWVVFPLPRRPRTEEQALTRLSPLASRNRSQLTVSQLSCSPLLSPPLTQA